MAKQKKALEKILDIFKDGQGNVVVIQKPNIPIIVWLTAAIMGYFISDGIAGEILDYVGAIALVFWALLEIFYGVNMFRRLLGLGVIFVTIL